MRKRIIFTSILIFLAVISAVLFGAVFCLREQSVTIVGNSPVSVSSNEIINAAQLKNGQSIFLIDKDQAISNIEKTFADIKVVQIKTTSVTKIEISVRARVETYYTYLNGNYYALDEDLKALKITTDYDDVKNLIHIQDGLLSISDNTQVCNFVGGEYQNVFYNLYTSIYKYATKTVDGEKQYLTRTEIIDFVEEVTIKEGLTQTESYKRVIVKTATGVVFDIAKPNEDLERKVNMCISAYESGNYDITKGTIKLFYTAEGQEDFDYFN